ncbi:MAG: hypothetical protein GY757_18815 [bacterium]|nr:hypothetical protein [bacterium]
MAINCFGRTDLIDGASNALDAILTASIANGDVSIVITTTRAYIYMANSTAGGSEDSPWLIAPDDVGGGNLRWELKAVMDLQNGIGSKTNVTIATGVITLDGPGKYTIDTEGGASTDDVDTIAISSGSWAVGDTIQLEANNEDDTVVIKNNATTKMSSDFSLNSKFDRIVLEYHAASTWVEVSRAHNG